MCHYSTEVESQATVQHEPQELIPSVSEAHGAARTWTVDNQSTIDQHMFSLHLSEAVLSLKI